MVVFLWWLVMMHDFYTPQKKTWMSCCWSKPFVSSFHFQERFYPKWLQKNYRKWLQTRGCGEARYHHHHHFTQIARYVCRMTQVLPRPVVGVRVLFCVCAEPRPGDAESIGNDCWRFSHYVPDERWRDGDRDWKGWTSVLFFKEQVGAAS